MTAPLPFNEEERLRILNALDILDTPEDAVFTALCEQAAQIYRAPIALISLVGKNRQWFKANVGLGCSETSRDVSFCAYAILQDTPLVVANTLNDDRFRTNSLVIGEPHLRFYAGAPLYYGDRIRLGTLCVLDTKPRDESQCDTTELERLADRVSGELWVHDAQRTRSFQTA